jgi:hypothetical protein
MHSEIKIETKPLLRREGFYFNPVRFDIKRRKPSGLQVYNPVRDLIWVAKII